MAERKIKGFFLGVPILSEGSHTEGKRLRRDGFGYAILSLFTYEVNDYITSAVFLFLTPCVIVNANIVRRTSFYFRLTLKLAFSVTLCAALFRSDMAGLLPAMIAANFACFGLMYFTHFDR